MNPQPLHLAETVAVHGIKTLLVDDSPLMLKVVAEILKQAGNFDLIGSASNGYQAVRYARMLSPELIVMDVHMPGLDGIQAARSIKRGEHPPLVIIVTSDDSPATRAAAELAGVDGFIIKNFSLRQQLIDTLRKICAPLEGAQNSAIEKPHVHCIAHNEKSENEQAPNTNARCANFHIATSLGKNSPARGPRMRHARRSGTHEPDPMARCRTTVQNKVSK